MASSSHRKSPRGKTRASGARAALRRQPAGGDVARAARTGLASDRFFRQLVTNMRNGVLAVMRDGTVAAINAEACRIFQLKRSAAAVGRPFGELLRSHPDVVRVLASAFELSHLPNRAELRLKSSGTVIGYTLSRIADDRGRVAGVAMFFKDLTRVEQIVERERLRDRLAALGEMAAAIAHEVKNPLAGIEVMAGLLRRQVPDLADAQSILTDIINEAKTANRIVHQALEFVRPIRLQVERTSMADVLQNAVAQAEHKVPRGDTSVRLEVDPSLPLVQADPHQLCQLFTNLLINAFEALDGGGAVTVAAREGVIDDDLGAGAEPHPPTPTLVVEVADDGPGVPPELTDRIFNAFFTTKPHGSGLGLAIVRKIVDAHDGRIDMVSGTGRGTRFRVTLPVSGGNEWFQ